MGKVSLICVALALAGCTLQERADVAAGLNAYNSGTASDWLDRAAPTDPIGGELGPAVIDTALRGASKATSIPELIAWLAGLIAVVGGGYVTRKWIQKRYTKTDAK